jgi:hypothetical protein
MDRITGAVANGGAKCQLPPAVLPLLPLTPKLTLVFWMLLGAVAGGDRAQSL